MKFRTKLWQRTEKSYATTIPQALLFLIDPTKRHYVEWSYDLKKQVWGINFTESKPKQGMGVFATLLWKRSQQSYATTVPISVLIHIDEKKKYGLEWEFDKKLQQWIILVVEAEK